MPIRKKHLTKIREKNAPAFDNPLKKGLVKESHAQYLEDHDYLSNSTFLNILRGPLLEHHDTGALKFGRYVHEAVEQYIKGETIVIPGEYYLKDGKTLKATQEVEKYTNAVKAILTLAKSKRLPDNNALDSEQSVYVHWPQVDSLIRLIPKTHPFARMYSLINQLGLKDKYHGLKCRVDILDKKNKKIYDVKTMTPSECVTMDRVCSQLAKYSYAWQAYFYNMVLTVNEGEGLKSLSGYTTFDWVIIPKTVGESKPIILRGHLDKGELPQYLNAILVRAVKQYRKDWQDLSGDVLEVEL